MPTNTELNLLISIKMPLLAKTHQINQYGLQIHENHHFLHHDLYHDF